MRLITITSESHNIKHSAQKERKPTAKPLLIPQNKLSSLCSRINIPPIIPKIARVKKMSRLFDSKKSTTGKSNNKKRNKKIVECELHQFLIIIYILRKNCIYNQRLCLIN